MTDEQWIAQNSSMGPEAATRNGLCWCCAGHRKIYSAFGGEQITTTCWECKGSGKAKK